VKFVVTSRNDADVNDEGLSVAYTVQRTTSDTRPALAMHWADTSVNDKHSVLNRISQADFGLN
jgi:hypothetical protein